MSRQDLTADLSKPLMPKATAMWLIDNTTLTFDQIGTFCGLHPIEVQALADEEVGGKIMSRNPVDHNELTAEEIKRGEENAGYQLNIVRLDLPAPKLRAKGPRYTPVTKRSDKPDAIAWLLKHHPELSDNAISKLVGSTKTTIQSIRDRSHPNTPNLRPRNPAEIGLCTYTELERVSHKALRAQGRDPVAEAEARRVRAEEEARVEQEAEEQAKPSTGGFDFSNFFKSTKTGA